MYKEYLDTVSVFETNGEVKPFGWSKEPRFFYNKINSSGSVFKRKESDTYIVHNNHLILTVTLANLGAYGFLSGFLIDLDGFKMGKKVVKKMLPFVKFRMPESSLSGDVAYNDNQIGVKFSKAGSKRFLKCDFLDFYDSKNLYFNIEIDENNAESMNVTVPFKSNKTSFFVKRFLPQMKATGLVRFGGSEYDLDDEKTSATLIWERYSTPNKENYHQLIAEGYYKKKLITLQLCDGISDDSAGIENCLFIDGKMRKLSKVKGKGRFSDVHSTWTFEDEERNIYIEFLPSNKNGGALHTEIDKRKIIYGNFYGHIFDEKGDVIKIDGFDGLLVNSII